MRRTLFLIPHEFGGIPLFGAGWLLIGLALFVIGRLAWVATRRDENRTVGSVIGQEGIMWATFVLVIFFVLPRAEIGNIEGEPLGLPVRGYGMFLMLAAIGSVGIAAWRAERAGLGSEMILRLAPWTFIGGLAGARLFYVIQYRADFIRDNLRDTLLAAAAFTQGGLVVYGGFIGGFLASAWAVRRFHGSLWKFGDVIVPCIFIGLFFGRLGCLMNGCCYGGQCDPSTLAVQFPPNSKVYSDQLLDGALIGLKTTPVIGKHTTSRGRTQRKVVSVDKGSLAAEAGIATGENVELILDPAFAQDASPETPAEDALPGLAVVRDGELLARFSPGELPVSAKPVWATQIISSMVAAVMFFTLLIVERVLRGSRFYRPGILMLTGFIAYGVLRIVLEWVRVDEAGQFGTAFSISQWVSFAVITLSGIAIVFRWTSEAENGSNNEQPQAAA